MPLTTLVGGARSGKSALAVRLAAAQPAPVVFVATAELREDEEMAARVLRHRAERPPEWTVVEMPLDLEGTLQGAGASTCVVIDCLTLWVANAMDAGWPAEDIERSAHRLAASAVGRAGPTFMVSNEVGSGIVPADANTRAYRDNLGRVNAICSAAADRAFLVVAGRLLPLAAASEVFDA
jgi:adenosyl cobinamide kinase/adenosyl cobinamide phosphate guanylyltransferase